MKDIFKFIGDNVIRLEQPLSFREGAFNFIPHIFQSPNDLYMTALLKESFEMSERMVAMVGGCHWVPIQRNWVPPPYGINMTEAQRVPARVEGESNEQLIEKHALLDSLLEDQVWGREWVANPFSYLTEDITKLGREELRGMLNTYRFNYRKYEEFKRRKWAQVPKYADRLFLKNS